MLFTVDIKSLPLSPAILLDQIKLGYGVKTKPFPLDRANINWIYDLPEESETGYQVVPGQTELDLVLKYFKTLVKWANVKEVRDLGFTNFKWSGHLYVDQPMYVQFAITRSKPRIMCTDIDWLAQTLHADGTPSFSMTIKQRIYP
jgi:hypothetical protein